MSSDALLLLQKIRRYKLQIIVSLGVVYNKMQAIKHTYTSTGLSFV